MAKKKTTERKILMPKGKGKIPLEEIRRAVREVKAQRERERQAARSQPSK